MPIQIERINGRKDYSFKNRAEFLQEDSLGFDIIFGSFSAGLKRKAVEG